MKTAAIVLGAGRGTRFGGGKMLAQVHGKPMLQHVLDLVAAAAFQPVIVVLGADAESIAARLSWRGEVRVQNREPDLGISSSLAMGLRALGDDVTRVLVFLGDQPFVALENVRAINDVGANPVSPVVVPRYANGQPGNPVLLERAAWMAALDLTGDQGMSQLFGSHPELVRYVDVTGSNPDADTPADLAALSRGGG